MKRLTLISFALTLSTAAFAQENSVSIRAPRTDSSVETSGFYVGFDYMNLTDLHVKYSVSYPDGSSDSESYQNGYHLGLAGVTIGYNHTPLAGFGFNLGTRLLQSFNKSEYGEEKLNLIIPEANLTLAMNETLVVYAGLNAAVWRGSSTINALKTRPGLQGGLSFRFAKNFALNAGYTVMNQKATGDLGSVSTEVDYQISGFNSNLTYLF